MAPPPPDVVGSLSSRRAIFNRASAAGSGLSIQLAPVPRAIEGRLYSRHQPQLVYRPDSIYGRARLLYAVPRSWTIPGRVDSRRVRICLCRICRHYSMAADAQRSRLGATGVPVLATRAKRREAAGEFDCLRSVSRNRVARRASPDTDLYSARDIQRLDLPYRAKTPSRAIAVLRRADSHHGAGERSANLSGLFLCAEARALVQCEPRIHLGRAGAVFRAQ